MRTPNLVRNPAFTGSNRRPTGWRFVPPRAELGPKPSVETTDKSRSLVLSGTGDIHAIGCWRGEAGLRDGRWYRATVNARYEGIEAPSLSVFAHVGQHVLLPSAGPGGSTLQREFQHRAADGNRVELYLRATPRGRVAWSSPSVIEIAQPKHRVARVATIRISPLFVEHTMKEQIPRVEALLEQAGALKPDIIAAPEFAPILGVSQKVYKSYARAAEAVPGGPWCRRFAEAAKRHKAYVIAGVIERRGKHVFNAAVLFDRRGGYVGQYDKTHLTFPELAAGISPGREYPVFDLDFGRIGIAVCFDEWIPEVARLFAHRGVEILFLPTLGGKPIVWRTRAIDNGLYFVASCGAPPSMIIDSSGAILAETHQDGVACADLNLDYRRVNAYGDPTLSYGMPGIAPQMRGVLDDRLIDELARAMKQS
jgi:predicted amidohydrolase